MAIIGRVRFVLRRLGLRVKYGSGVAQELDRAHEHSIRHRDEIEASEQCGCFYCLSIFPPGAITEWIPGEGTAFCPKCGIDSVIGSESGFPITRRFLAQMYQKWF